MRIEVPHQGSLNHKLLWEASKQQQQQQQQRQQQQQQQQQQQRTNHKHTEEITPRMSLPPSSSFYWQSPSHNRPVVVGLQKSDDSMDGNDDGTVDMWGQRVDLNVNPPFMFFSSVQAAQLPREDSPFGTTWGFSFKNRHEYNSLPDDVKKALEPTPLGSSADMTVLPSSIPIGLTSLYGEQHTNDLEGDDLPPMQDDDFDKLFDDDDDISVTRPPTTLAVVTSSSLPSSPSLDAPSAPKSVSNPSARREWTSSYHDLIEYKSIFGHCEVSSQSKGKHHGLGQWVKRQRYHFKLYQQGKPSSMNEDRVRLLESIGFVWDSHASQWEERFGELTMYWKKHGNCNVPRNCTQHPKLATWVKRQRRMYASNHMLASRIERLERLGFIWKARAQQVNQSKAAMKASPTEV